MKTDGGIFPSYFPKLFFTRLVQTSRQGSKLLQKSTERYLAEKNCCRSIHRGVNLKFKRCAGHLFRLVLVLVLVLSSMLSRLDSVSCWCGLDSNTTPITPIYLAMSNHHQNKTCLEILFFLKGVMSFELSGEVGFLFFYFFFATSHPDPIWNDVAGGGAKATSGYRASCPVTVNVGIRFLGKTLPACSPPMTCCL